MCGIAGFMTAGAPIEAPSALADRFACALAHRGPDGEGRWLSPSADVLLVHRRLAIIDPSPAGAQPMATSDGRHHLVFNGEIYNYAALRRDLEQLGERFATASDTEVLLRLMAREGPAALARVRGMFAFACWDRDERALLLARDRFGIKPLYAAATHRGVAFASEIHALRASRLVDNRPSSAGVVAFLRWGSVPPTLTWQRDVEAIPAGGWRRYSQGGGQCGGTFADTRAAYLSDRRRPQTAGAFREAAGAAVRDSVRAHLVADVPVGVFLSGGIDSSALVSAATSLGAAGLQTFTVGFETPASEAAAAQTIASQFGTQHHPLIVAGADVRRDLPAILARLDSPTIDGINSYYVARAVAASGIKAVLSGTGGDELFGGYPSFTRVPLAASARRTIGPLWPAVAPLGAWLLPQRLGARWRHFAAADGGLVESYRVQRGFLMPEELAALIGPALTDDAGCDATNERVAAVERECLEALGDEQASASIARLESRLYLESQLLRDIDAMSMAHGLEVRVPFVDHEILDVVWPELGFHQALLSHKKLLHDTLALPLPDAIVQRPKQGFILPFEKWLVGDLAPVVHEGLERLAAGGWIRRDAPDRVWTDWRNGATHWSRPWGLSVLGHFLGGE
jgi:asparagine synthase (glutamine-hydrolysing)